MDCAIFVCFIIRQYIHEVEIGNTMDGLTPFVLCAAMVKMFLNDSKKGLRAWTA
ncbi:hypothetical protein ACSBR2_042058 [Camellia fascicularis]